MICSICQQHTCINSAVFAVLHLWQGRQIWTTLVINNQITITAKTQVQCLNLAHLKSRNTRPRCEWTSKICECHPQGRDKWGQIYFPECIYLWRSNKDVSILFAFQVEISYKHCQVPKWENENNYIYIYAVFHGYHSLVFFKYRAQLQLFCSSKPVWNQFYPHARISCIYLYFVLLWDWYCLGLRNISSWTRGRVWIYLYEAKTVLKC